MTSRPRNVDQAFAPSESEGFTFRGLKEAAFLAFIRPFCVALERSRCSKLSLTCAPNIPADSDPCGLCSGFPAPPRPDQPWRGVTLSLHGSVALLRVFLFLPPSCPAPSLYYYHFLCAPSPLHLRRPGSAASARDRSHSDLWRADIQSGGDVSHVPTTLCIAAGKAVPRQEPQ